MERKLHPGVRPAHSVPRYARPTAAPRRSRVVVAVTQPIQDVTPVMVEPQGPVVQQQPPIKPVEGIVRAGQPHRSVTRFNSDPVPAETAKPVKTTQAGVYFDMKPVAVPKPAAPETPKISHTIAAPQLKSAAPHRVESIPAQPTAVVLKRELKRDRKSRRFTFKKPHLLYGMASLLFIVGMYVAIDGWLVNRAASTQTEVLAAQAADPSNDRDHLTEDEPSGTEGYKVAPDLPRTIQIPSIGVNARVLQLGVKANNELATPTNIHDAGWYTGSSKPTDKAGAILLDGHVSGPTKKGVFYNLKKLKAGDEMILERGDGTKLSFVVTRTKTVKTEEVDMLEMMRSDEPSKLALNLITCGGTFDAEKNEFESRVLVFAVQK